MSLLRRPHSTALILSSLVAANRIECITLTQVRNFAARKGTRARKEKKKVKHEVVKVGFIPHNLRDKDKNIPTQSKKFDDSWKRDPIDNVYVHKYYKWKVYPFAEAVQCHRETHHPEMYNQPNAPLLVKIELNMQAEKKTRFVDNFKRIAPIPHKFEHGEERLIMVFSKSPEDHVAAKNEGAQLAGGLELIKEVQDGSISLKDFQFIIAHPNILPELVQLRGLLKKRFPNPGQGTLHVDVANAVKKFINGVGYSAVKDEIEKDFGEINTVIGTLNMDIQHLEENFSSLICDVFQAKPKRSGSFITRCVLMSPPSGEVFKVDHNVYLENSDESSNTDGSDAEEEEEKKEGIATV